MIFERLPACSFISVVISGLSPKQADSEARDTVFQLDPDCYVQGLSCNDTGGGQAVSLPMSTFERTHHHLSSTAGCLMVWGAPGPRGRLEGPSVQLRIPRNHTMPSDKPVTSKLTIA